MKTKYQLTETLVVLDTGNEIRTFGIRTVGCNTDGTAICEFKDVSVNIKNANRILEILNRFDVEFCHFNDVIIDELNR